MNFYDQSIEMKRTLLEASVGKVSISAHGLESNLLLLYCIKKTNNDADFNKQYNTSITLGKLIGKVKKLDIFDDDSLNILIKALEQRNSFTHHLSEKYIASIENSGSMYQLIQELISIQDIIEKADNLVITELKKMAVAGDFDINSMKSKAKLAVQKWENY